MYYTFRLTSDSDNCHNPLPIYVAGIIQSGIDSAIRSFDTNMHPATVFRKPDKSDGMRVHQLVQQCPPLDPNSSYCNLLQCTHFADTCVIAERDQQIAGFISGYLKPNTDDTLFVWQVAVSESARGCGLASQMLAQLLKRKGNQHIRFIETTITSDNAGSWGLFEKLAKSLNAPLQRSNYFDEHEHFNDQHASELLARIGPFAL